MTARSSAPSRPCSWFWNGKRRRPARTRRRFCPGSGTAPKKARAGESADRRADAPCLRMLADFRCSGGACLEKSDPTGSNRIFEAGWRKNGPGSAGAIRVPGGVLVRAAVCLPYLPVFTGLKGQRLPMHCLFSAKWVHVRSSVPSISTPRCSFENSIAALMER